MAGSLLDHITVVARPRNLGEVHDLAALLVRRHAGPLLVLGTVGLAPWVVLDALLLSLVPRPGLAAWLLAVLAFAQAPLAVAPITCFLGQAMFSPRPRIRDAWGPALRALPALALVGLWRAVCALTLIGLPWSLGHLTEVLCLERQGFMATWQRARALTHVGHAREVLHLLTAAVTVVIAIWVVTGTVQAFDGLLRRGDLWHDGDFEEWLPGHAVLPTIGLWLGLAYLGVVRFVNYLDLRTRHEGWDVELDLRRAAGRLPGGGT